MDSADKVHWWQKKSFWIAVAGVAGGVAAAPVPGIIRTVAIVIAAVATGIGGYGAVEVARSNAAANKALAASKAQQVQLLMVQDQRAKTAR